MLVIVPGYCVADHAHFVAVVFPPFIDIRETQNRLGSYERRCSMFPKIMLHRRTTCLRRGWGLFQAGRVIWGARLGLFSPAIRPSRSSSSNARHFAYRVTPSIANRPLGSRKG